MKYPTVESIIADQSNVVESWTIDDVAKSLKQIEAAITKIELALAKQPSFEARSLQQNGVKELRKLLQTLNSKLNRLLGIAF